MAVIIDGRVTDTSKTENKSGGAFYGSTSVNTNKSGFIKQENRKDLAQLVIKAFVESPQFLATYASEAAAVTAGVKSGTIYKTATGEIRVKL